MSSTTDSYTVTLLRLRPRYLQRRTNHLGTIAVNFRFALWCRIRVICVSSSVYRDLHIRGPCQKILNLGPAPKNTLISRVSEEISQNSRFICLTILAASGLLLLIDNQALGLLKKISRCPVYLISIAGLQRSFL